jgi:hypothetical protein
LAGGGEENFESQSGNNPQLSPAAKPATRLFLQASLQISSDTQQHTIPSPRPKSSKDAQFARFALTQAYSSVILRRKGLREVACYYICLLETNLLDSSAATCYPSRPVTITEALESEASCARILSVAE